MPFAISQGKVEQIGAVVDRTAKTQCADQVKPASVLSLANRRGQILPGLLDFIPPEMNPAESVHHSPVPRIEGKSLPGKHKRQVKLLTQQGPEPGCLVQQ